jgi:4-amino-4-deoxy-L-arabinose transferase-like glycosyltransferase
MVQENYGNIKKTNILGFLNVHKTDIIFVIFCILLTLYYDYYISLLKVPSHDGAVYLLNAQAWLNNKPLDEIYRPPLISWIIAGIWAITGENWVIVKDLQPIFTISAGIILYVLLRKFKGSLFAFGVATLTMINGTLFYFSTQIMTEGLALFFLVLTLYFLKSRKENYWFFAGIAIGLTFASRYPIALQALVIFIVESIVSRRPKLAIRTILGALIVFIIVISAVHVKAGTFHAALAKDSTFTFLLSPFYLVNSFKIWGFAFLLVPIALLSPRTYTDSFNYAFIAWFIVSLLFWSASSGNWQYRFAIQYTPAVYFLSILAIENIKKGSITRNSLRSYFISVKSSLKSLKRNYRYHILGQWD